MLSALNRKSPAIVNESLNTVRNDLEAMRQYMSQIFDPWFSPPTMSDGFFVGSYPVDLSKAGGKILGDAELLDMPELETKHACAFIDNHDDKDDFDLFEVYNQRRI